MYSRDSVSLSFHMRNESTVDVSDDTGTLILGVGSYPTEIRLFINPWIAKRIIDALTPFSTTDVPAEPEAVAVVEQEVQF